MKKGEIILKRTLMLFGLLVFAAANLLSQQSESSTIAEPDKSVARPGGSSWSIRISVLAQHKTGNKFNLWYEYSGSDSTIFDDHLAGNGIGSSLGIDFALEYKITDRFALGIAAGYIPTKLHAEAHYPVPYQSILEVERTDARMPYLPIRLTANYDLFNWAKWSIQGGLQCGVGIFRSTDVHVHIGKSRRFYGDASLVLGAQVGVTRLIAKGLSIASILQYQRTHFKIEELGTGDLKQAFPFKPLSLSLGFLYSFGH